MNQQTSKSLLDLPDELLLSIASTVDADSRRNLSLTCRRCFHVLRDQDNWRSVLNFQSMKNIDYFKIRDVGNALIVITHMENDSLTPYYFIVFSQKSDIIDPNMDTAKYLRKHGIRRNIDWMDSEDPYETVIALLREALKKIEVSILCYRANAAIFNVPFASEIIKLHHSPRFCISNGELSKRSEDIYFETLKLFLDQTEPPMDGSLDERSFSVSESFKPNAPHDELSLSNTRLRKSVKNLLQQKGIIDNVQLLHQYTKDDRRCIYMHVYKPNNICRIYVPENVLHND